MINELNIYYVSNQTSFTREFNSFNRATINDVVIFLETLTEIGVDTETEGFFNHSNKILMFQIGNKERQYVIDCTTVDFTPLKKILEDPTKVKILANASFDYKFMRLYGIMMNNIYDTQIAEMVLNTGLNVKVGLAACAEKYLGVILEKDIRTEFTSNFTTFTQSQIEYGAKDILYLIDIKEKQMEKIKSYNLENVLNLELLFTPVLADIEYNGFYLDKERWKNIYLTNKEKVITSVKSLDSHVIDNNHSSFIDYQMDMFSTGNKCTINWASSPQVIKYLKFLGVNTQVVVKGKTKDTCEEGHISKFKEEFPFISKYLEYKKITKELSTYGLDFLNHVNKVTGRVHSSYWQIQSTGRISSNNPNLQNIPARPNKEGKALFREAFRGQEENVLVVADYAAQEQRCLADQCKDPALLDFYENGDGDMHCLIVRKIFPSLKDTPTNVIKKEYSKERNFAKTIGFALNYGGSEHTIADRLRIPLEEADELVKSYFSGFPVMTQYFKRKTKETFKNGYINIDTITNRKSFLPFMEEFKELEKMVKEKGFWEKYRQNKEEYKESVRKYFVHKGTIERNSQNYPTQGLSGSMTKYAAILIKRKLMQLDLYNEVKIVNLVHDECVVETPLIHSEYVAKIVSSSMEEAGNKFCKIVPMKAEACITKYWTH